MISNILDFPFIYSIWQGPFINQKIAPFLNENSSKLTSDKIIVELGCGPGINTSLFRETKYIGFDLNQNYILKAKKKYPNLNFFVSDVSSLDWLEHLNELGFKRVDYIFINSLLHHLEDSSLIQMFDNCLKIFDENSTLFITDLIRPENGIKKFLAENDRGKFTRKEEEWRGMIAEKFSVFSWQKFELKLFNLGLWDMFYCSAKSKKG